MKQLMKIYNIIKLHEIGDRIFPPNILNKNITLNATDGISSYNIKINGKEYNVSATWDGGTHEMTNMLDDYLATTPSNNSIVLTPYIKNLRLDFQLANPGKHGIWGSNTSTNFNDQYKVVGAMIWVMDDILQSITLELQSEAENLVNLLIKKRILPARYDIKVLPILKSLDIWAKKSNKPNGDPTTQSKLYMAYINSYLKAKNYKISSTSTHEYGQRIRTKIQL